jgi:hypothetical protein
MTDFYIERKWNVSIKMTVTDFSTGNSLNDYEYEVSFGDRSTVENAVSGRQAPLNGESLIGTFRVQRRRFAPEQYSTEWDLAENTSYTQTGTITIHGTGGRIARTRFELTVNGNNPASVTPRALLTWDRR